MKKKIVNAIELVMLLASFVILNLATIEVQNLSVSTATNGHMAPLTLMKHYITIYPTYFFYAVIAVMCVVSIITKSEHREGRIHSILPILWFVSVNYNVITLSGKVGNWLIVSSKDFPGMLFEGCAIAVVILGFLKRASFIAGVPRVQTTSNAEELAKYKELLDAGAITQEEFDKKKKQLLK